MLFDLPKSLTAHLNLSTFQQFLSLLSMELRVGSSQVIGKALVLDEIINYIQSLQRQVEV